MNAYVSQACTNYQAAQRAGEAIEAEPQTAARLFHELFLLTGSPDEPMDANERMLRFNLMRKAIHRTLTAHFEGVER